MRYQYRLSGCRQFLRGVLALFIVQLFATASFAGPILQLYLEGGSYDAATESWTVIGASSEPIRIWTIGNVSGPGGKGTIFDVRLAVGYDSNAGVTVINLVPSTTGGFNGFADPSTPGAPVHLQTVSDGSTPTLSDGGSLPSHGEYGPGRTWQEFALGDFTLTDSPIGDFIDNFPTTFSANAGQISVYEVTVEGTVEDTVELHFDLYDHVQTKTKIRAVFAPFSHDATGTVDVAPEPGSLIVWAMGLGVFGLARLYRKRTSRPAA